MPLTTYERRGLGTQSLVVDVLKITMPDDTVYYLTSHNADQLATFRLSYPTNPIIENVALMYGDLGRVNTISIECRNEKLSQQEGNPLNQAVHFSDLITDGLWRATAELKRLTLSNEDESVTINDFDSTDLRGVFKGRLKRPDGGCGYSQDSITLPLTDEDLEHESEFPEETIGEDVGDPDTEVTVAPVMLGSTRSPILFRATNEVINASGLPIVTDIRLSPCAIADPIGRIIAVSSKAVSHYHFDFLTAKIGDFPPGVVREDDYGAWFIDSDFPGWELMKMMRETFRVYPVIRMDAAKPPVGNPWGETDEAWAADYDHEDIGPRGSEVVLAPDETLAVATPQIANTGNTINDRTNWLIEIDLPEGTAVQAQIYTQNRETGGDVLKKTLDPIRPGDLRAGYYMTNRTETDGLWKAYPTEDRKDWLFYSENLAVSVCLKRIDGLSGKDVRIRGIYAMPCAIYTWKHERVKRWDYGYTITGQRRTPPQEVTWLLPVEEPGDLSFGASGLALVDPYDHPAGHPAAVIEAACTDIVGITNSIGGKASYQGIEDFRLGGAFNARETGRSLINGLAEQVGGHMVRGRDGTHYFYLHARYGAKPTAHRITRKFSWLREVRDVPKIEPLGASWVKNAITVYYQRQGSNQYAHRAWVHGHASDNGYGHRIVAAETVSAQSISDHGRKRLSIHCPFIQAADTAEGLVKYLLSRYAQPATRIMLPTAPACLEWLPGQFIQFDDSLDEFLLFNGASWDGKWFEIEDIRTQGKEFVIRALSVPTVEIAEYAMGPNIMSIGG